MAAITSLRLGPYLFYQSRCAFRRCSEMRDTSVFAHTVVRAGTAGRPEPRETHKSALCLTQTRRIKRDHRQEIKREDETKNI
ncbi:Protein of unknown function [Gryllus bimaculatus]|nr:Protein of unknown function [Gryllus bimaculatus]